MSIVGLIVLMGTALLILLAILLAGMTHHVTHPARRTTGWAMANGLPSDPAEAGAGSFDTVTIADASGSNLELWLVPGRAEAEHREGPTIVMLHGWSDGRLGELLWLATLLPHAGRVVMYDQRGHGESAQQRCTLGDREADDAIAVVRWLRQREPERPIVLFGYSMGAAVAIEAVRRMGEEGEGGGAAVDAIVADSPYRYFSAALAGTLKLNNLPGRSLAPIAGWLTGADRLDVLEAAKRVTQSMLVLHGTDDPVAKLADAKAIAAAAPNARHVEIADAQHLDAAWVNPDVYEQALRELMHQVNVRGAKKKARPTET